MRSRYLSSWTALVAVVALGVAPATAAEGDGHPPAPPAPVAAPTEGPEPTAEPAADRPGVERPVVLIDHGGPVAPIDVVLDQPDGATFDAVPWGDDVFGGYETPAGFTVVRGEDASWYYAAGRRPDGSLRAGQQRPDRGRPPAGTPRHQRPEHQDAHDAQEAPADGSFQAPGGTDGDDAGGGGSGLSTIGTGTHHSLVILVEFTDRASVGSTPADWADRYFGATDSVAHYYDEVSYGALDIVPAADTDGASDGVVGWLPLPRTHPNTGPSTDPDRYIANRTLAAEAIAAADAYVDYGQYDADGDGSLEPHELHITVIPAGYETAYGGAASACQPGVWGHMSGTSGQTLDGKTVGLTYTMFGEWHQQGATTADPTCSSAPTSNGHLATLGIMVHEIGHDIGLPDLYDVDGTSAGVGRWSVMGGGSWNSAGGFSGTSPAQPDAFSKIYLGWVEPTIVTGEEAGVAVASATTTPDIRQVRRNDQGLDWTWGGASGTGEYFLVENRQQTSYDAGLPGCGLVVYHINEAASGSNTYANAVDLERLVDVEQADGSENNGDPGDPFPGSTSNLLFDSSTTPSSRLIDSSLSGVRIVPGAGACADTMTADLSAIDGVAPPCPTDDAREDVDDTHTTGTMLASGNSLAGVICADDVDWFRISADAGDELVFQLDHYAPQGDLDLRLTDGAQVLEASTSLEELETLTYVADATATYYLEVSGFEGAENDYTLGLTVTDTATFCPPDDIFEPNNHTDVFAELQHSTRLHASSCAGPDPEPRDSFGVDTTGGTITVNLTHSGAQGDLAVFLFSSSGGGSLTGSYTGFSYPAAAGSYVVEVHNWSNTADHTYTLDVTVPGMGSLICTAADANESNDTRFSATPLGSSGTASGEICQSDVDVYSFAATAGDVIDADVTFTHNFGDLDAELIGPDGKPVAVSDSDDDDEGFLHTATSTGTYYLRIAGYGIDHNDYSVTVATTPGTQPRFDVEPRWDALAGTEWAPSSSLAISVTRNLAEVFSSTTEATSPEGTFNVDLWGQVDIVAGDVISISDGTTTKSHTVTSLTLDAVDFASETVSGDAAADSTVVAQVVDTTLGHLHELQIVATAGFWSADFTGTYDITTADNVHAVQRDDDLDATRDTWHNDAPVAVGDTLTTVQNTAATIDVLANDHDPDGDAIAVSDSTDGTNGTVNCATATECTYTPATDFTGSDSFTYTVEDGRGGSAVGTVAVTVNACVEDSYEPNDSRTEDVLFTLESGTPIEATLCPEGDVDYYTIDAQAGDTITANATYDATGGADLELSILDSDGTVLATSAEVGTGAESVSWEVVQAGSFYVSVLGSASTYSLAVWTGAFNRLEAESDPGFSWSPGWSTWTSSSQSAGASRYSTGVGRSVSFEFSGTAVRWVSSVGPARGIAEVHVDGALVDTVDTYAASYAQQQAVFTATGLAEGEHTLTVTFVGLNPSASSGAAVVVDAIETDGQPLVWNRLEAESDPGFSWSPGWSTWTSSSQSAGASRYSTGVGRSVSFEFSGTAVRWVSSVGPARGIAEVHVDGALVDTVDTYAASYAQQQAVFTATGLAEGEHTLTVTFVGLNPSASSGAAVVVDAIETDGQPLVWNRLEAESDPGFSWSPGWSTWTHSGQSSGASRYTTGVGRSVSFEFSGTAVRWVSSVGPARGIAEVHVDGALVDTVDTYAASYAQQQAVFTATGLAEGEHTLTVTFVGLNPSASSGAAVVVDAIETDGQPLVWNRLEAESDPGFSWSPGWSTWTHSGQSSGASRYTTGVGRSVSIEFSGTAVRWVSSVGPARGIAEVHVDGVLVDTVDTYAASYAHQREVSVISALPSGLHTLTISFTGANPSASATPAIVVDAIETA